MEKKVLLVLFLLLLPYVQAWSWDSYEGKTTWDVVVTVDEKGCGGTVYSNNARLTITHKKSVADLTDLGHGPVSGTFFSNILTIPGRTIPDGSGRSALGSASVAFSPDCLSFYTKYTWRYNDQYQSCSGTTAWKGKRTDAQECPDAFIVTEPAQQQQVQQDRQATAPTAPPAATAPAPATAQGSEAQPTVAGTGEEPAQPPTLPSAPAQPAPQQSEEIEPSPAEEQTYSTSVIKGLPASERKAEYEKRLRQNPNDYEANYEIGEMLKEEKEYAAFISHIDKALLNRNEAAKLKAAREKEVTQRLQLTIRPNGVTVPFLRSIEDEIDNEPQPMIYSQPLSKAKDTRSWRQRLTEYFSKPFTDVVRN